MKPIGCFSRESTTFLFPSVAAMARCLQILPIFTLKLVILFLISHLLLNLIDTLSLYQVSAKSVKIIHSCGGYITVLKSYLPLLCL